MIPTLKTQSGQRIFVDEQESAVIRGSFFDWNESAFDKTDITALALTIQEEVTEHYVNEKNALDILDKNGGSINVNGDLQVLLTGDDNAVILRNGSTERHIITIQWQWDAGGTNTGTGYKLYGVDIRPNTATPEIAQRDGRINGPLLIGESYALSFWVSKQGEPSGPAAELVFTGCGDTHTFAATGTDEDSYYWRFDFTLSEITTATIRSGDYEYRMSVAGMVIYRGFVSWV